MGSYFIRLSMLLYLIWVHRYLCEFCQFLQKVCQFVILMMQESISSCFAE